MLTKEQFLELRKKGLTTRQIVEFEKRDQPVGVTKTIIPEKKETPLDTVPAIGKGVGEAAIGAIKGVGSTLSGLSSLGQKGLEATVGAGLRKVGIGEEPPEITAGEVAKEKFFTPEGTAQKIGFGAEQLAEFFTPAGLTKLAKGKGLLTRMGVDAFGLGAVTAAQEGKIEKEAKTSAVIGAAFPVLGKITKTVSKGIPETAWSNILKRTPTEAAKKPELTKQAAQTGITGISRKSISGQLQKKIEGVELKLDDLLSGKVDKVETKNVVKYLDDLRKSYKSIPGEGSSVKVINKISKEVSKNKELTVKEANTVKRNIYKMISKSYGKGMLEPPVKTESQKMIARGLKKEIEKIIPEAKTLNEKQAIYIQMKKAIEKTIARREGKGVFGTGIGLYDLMIGGIAGGFYGGTTGLAAVVGAKAAGSAAVSSGTSKMINYFNTLSPTKKMFFYNAIKGLTAKEITDLMKKSRPVSDE